MAGELVSSDQKGYTKREGRPLGRGNQYTSARAGGRSAQHPARPRAGQGATRPASAPVGGRSAAAGPEEKIESMSVTAFESGAASELLIEHSGGPWRLPAFQDHYMCSTSASGAPWMVALMRAQKRLGHDVSAIVTVRDGTSLRVLDDRRSSSMRCRRRFSLFAVSARWMRALWRCLTAARSPSGRGPQPRPRDRRPGRSRPGSRTSLAISAGTLPRSPSNLLCCVPWKWAQFLRHHYHRVVHAHARSVPRHGSRRKVGLIYYAVDQSRHDPALR